MLSTVVGGGRRHLRSTSRPDLSGLVMCRLESWLNSSDVRLLKKRAYKNARFSVERFLVRLKGASRLGRGRYTRRCRHRVLPGALMLRPAGGGVAHPASSPVLLKMGERW